MQRSLTTIAFLICISWTLVPSVSHAAVAWDETANGDLSNDRTQPTLVPLSVGTNSLVASMGLSNAGADLDYMRINLPANTELTGIVLQKFDGPDSTGFIGVQAGNAFTIDPSQAYSMIGSLLGWTHFGPGNGDAIGQNILPHLGQGAGAIGFIGPLTGPAYSFWIQQTGFSTNYQLDFVVAQVPEPATLALAAPALLLVALRRYAR